MAGAQGKVYFIGAGPGDPELLTLKGKRLIEAADVVIYADSLVPESIAAFANQDAEVHGSKTMALPEIMELMLRSVRQGKIVARIQSGDPSIYGAILEQMRILESNEVEYEIVPGVSAAFAAAALLKTELTVPEVSQTVILTRAEGRVSMPPREQLRDLAAHGCSLIVFLSVTRMTKVVRELLAAGYSKETPVAVVYRVGWPEEQVIRGDLSDIAAKIRESKITLQALIMVGEAMNPHLRDPLPAAEQPQATSHLYSQDYTHLYRRSPSRPDILGPRIKSGEERVPSSSAPPPSVPLSDNSGGP
jgi:precorrin-4/cobalt-precorrin-4 C11-methyltransferase